ncbi:MAG: hypothetical protein LBU36_00960 [Clostridiales bacterium]|nr:hypothetical protein [Clostridiales bacterium]
MTGAERKIGGKKVAFRQALVPKNTGQEGGFSAGISAEKHQARRPVFSGGHERLQQLFGGAKIDAGRPEKTPSNDFENCYIRNVKEKAVLSRPKRFRRLATRRAN